MHLEPHLPPHAGCRAMRSPCATQGQSAVRRVLEMPPGRLVALGESGHPPCAVASPHSTSPAALLTYQYAPTGKLVPTLCRTSYVASMFAVRHLSRPARYAVVDSVPARRYCSVRRPPADWRPRYRPSASRASTGAPAESHPRACNVATSARCLFPCSYPLRAPNAESILSEADSITSHLTHRRGAKNEDLRQIAACSLVRFVPPCNSSRRVAGDTLHQAEDLRQVEACLADSFART